MRAQLSRKQVITINKYEKLLLSHHMPFESDAIPAVTILQKNILDEKNLRIVPSDFLSSSVFEMHLRQSDWDQLPQDVQKILMKASLYGGNRLTDLLAQKEKTATQKISLTHDDSWQRHDLKNSQTAYDMIFHATPQNIEIARAYENFRKATPLFSKKIS